MRRIALSLPGASEKPYNRLPSFRVSGKLFARIHERPGVVLVFCVDVAEKEGLVAAEPEKFFSTPHYDGGDGLLVRLAEVEVDELAELLTDSWRLRASSRLRARLESRDA